MSTQKKHFIHRNEGFECLRCGFENGPLKGSCRNHCRQCLSSRHVDDQVPGDRVSQCQGLMSPARLDQKKKGKMIVHVCEKCGKEMLNKVADDDDLDAVIELGLKLIKG
jgi:DNA-directed RNA polymerase subunit RPC12/RpoP